MVGNTQLSLQIDQFGHGFPIRSLASRFERGVHPSKIPGICGPWPGPGPTRCFLSTRELTGIAVSQRANLQHFWPRPATRSSTMRSASETTAQTWRQNRRVPNPSSFSHQGLATSTRSSSRLEFRFCFIRLCSRKVWPGLGYLIKAFVLPELPLAMRRRPKGQVGSYTRQMGIRGIALKHPWPCLAAWGGKVVDPLVAHVKSLPPVMDSSPEMSRSRVALTAS